MGGLTLKQFGVERADKQKYERIKNLVLKKLSGGSIRINGKGYALSGSILNHVFIPPHLPEKESFGDLDVLIGCWQEMGAIVDKKETIKYLFSPKNIVINGNCYSFDIEDFQVDFIFCSKEDFPVYANFIRWGDSSMFYGRIARTFDLKFGIYGLDFIVRDDETNHVIKEINISKDPKRIMEFLGYDYERYLAGFSSESELTQYIFSSKYITKDFLQEYSENTKHRKRDKNREQYKRIFEWFQNNLDKFPDTSPEYSVEERLNMVEKFFPKSNIRAEYDECLKTIKMFKEARNKFSGAHILEILNLDPKKDGKEFGEFMQKWDYIFIDKDVKASYIIKTEIEKLTALCRFVFAFKNEEAAMTTLREYIYFQSKVS